ncbi:MAG: hypothetical protein Q4B54_08820 [Coriobacteriales bacterium]|nr:hypothetical protein [Coriobacteriales bacterium]
MNGNAENTTATADGLPDNILTYEAERAIRYGLGIDVPQTPFGMWTTLGELAGRYVEHWADGDSLMVGALGLSERSGADLRGIVEICERNRRATYGSSRDSLLAWLARHGVEVEEGMLMR